MVINKDYYYVRNIILVELGYLLNFENNEYLCCD